MCHRNDSPGSDFIPIFVRKSATYRKMRRPPLLLPLFLHNTTVGSVWLLVLHGRSGFNLYWCLYYTSNAVFHRITFLQKYEAWKLFRYQGPREEVCGIPWHAFEVVSVTCFFVVSFSDFWFLVWWQKLATFTPSFFWHSIWRGLQFSVLWCTWWPKGGFNLHSYNLL